MHPSNTRARCSLHLLLVGRDGDCPDPAGLLAVLGHRAEAVTVVAWTAGGDGPSRETVHRAADLLDDVEQLTGTRPKYLEAEGDLAGVVGWLTGSDPSPVGGSIIAVSARAPRRIVRALRRPAAAAGAHLALLPQRSVPSPRSLTT